MSLPGVMWTTSPVHLLSSEGHALSVEQPIITNIHFNIILYPTPVFQVMCSNNAFHPVYSIYELSFISFRHGPLQYFMLKHHPFLYCLKVKHNPHKTMGALILRDLQMTRGICF